jgi:hypothetical protein
VALIFVVEARQTGFMRTKGSSRSVSAGEAEEKRILVF